LEGKPRLHGEISVIFIGILGIFEAIDAISELTDEICIMILRIPGSIDGNCGGTSEM
jgi:hypothetical protein